MIPTEVASLISDCIARASAISADSSKGSTLEPPKLGRCCGPEEIQAVPAFFVNESKAASDFYFAMGRSRWRRESFVKPVLWLDRGTCRLVASLCTTAFFFWELESCCTRFHSLTNLMAFIAVSIADVWRFSKTRMFPRSP